MKRSALLFLFSMLAPAQSAPDRADQVVYFFHGPIPARAEDETKLIHWLHVDLAAQSHGIEAQEARRQITHYMARVQGEW